MNTGRGKTRGEAQIKVQRAICLLALAVFLAAATAWATVSGSISGTVTDASNRVIPQARISAEEVNTGLKYETSTDGEGYYTLPVLPVGRYELTVEAQGFDTYVRKGIVLDTSAALTLDAVLEIGNVRQTVTVSDNSLHIETSSTQMGQVISGREMAAVPLNGRSYTDLLALQPGVAPETAITASTVQDVGATVLNPSGTLNPGNLSVNGQRETANYFSVNGSDTEEDVNAGTAVIPNLDAIAEFRIVTGDFDAEYGEYSGGQISVITKQGSNELHGDAFNFLRNTDLDARNYFSPTRGVFRQNQFGGTVGGPLKRDRVFFFVDYQGTRQAQGIDTGEIPVPSVAEQGGDFNALASSFATTVTLPSGQQVTVPTAVSGPYLATQVLAPAFGYGVTQGEPYYFTAGESYLTGNSVSTYSHNCTSFLRVRLSQFANSAIGVVSAGAADAPIHPSAEHVERDFLDVGIQPDGRGR